MKDCLLIGFNDTDFEDFVEMIRGMGESTGTFRDLNLAFCEIDGRPYRCLDLLNHLMDRAGMSPETPYENCDFVWPVILYLGSYLHRRGFTFDYVNLFHRDKDELVRKLTENSYRAIAITTTVYVSPHPIIEIVELIRDIDVDAPVIIGGPYIANQQKVMSEEALSMLLSHLGGDLYVFSAEGEATLAKVLQRLREDAPLDDVENLAVRVGDADFEFHPLKTERNDLEHEPVNYALFGGDQIGEFVSLRTAKSCPFACSFCGFPQRAGKYTYTGLDAVARDLDAIRELGTVTTLTFLDDTFNVPKGRFKDILRLMIDRDYGFRWNSFYRSDHGDAETIELMAASGCEGVFLGIESGSDAMLERMNNSARRADYFAAIRKFHEVGISTYGSFIVGFPGESTQTVEETIEFIETSAPTFYRAQLYYLDPATPVWRDREKLGVTGGGFEWTHPTMTSGQASDIIERMFIEIKNSTWAPQHGFEDWSIYYLKRRGFSLEEVVAFVAGFNRLVKMKLRGPGASDMPQTILDDLTTLASQTRRRYLTRPLAAPAKPPNTAQPPIEARRTRLTVIPSDGAPQ
ncbi:MAG: PhpK family radical SAM P-methyltransferase [Myxococcota bacterium]